MPIIKRFNSLENLQDIDILFEETGATSTFFNITEFPDPLKVGKNSFLIDGSAKLANFTEVKIINGTVITDSKLIIAVRENDKATSPLAKDVNKFEVTPPGAEAIIITPIANSGLIGQILTRVKAIIGNNNIWQIAPTKKSFGCLITRIKSLVVKPNPKANIMKANARGKIKSVTIFIKKYYKI